MKHAPRDPTGAPRSLLERLRADAETVGRFGLSPLAPLARGLHLTNGDVAELHELVRDLIAAAPTSTARTGTRTASRTTSARGSTPVAVRKAAAARVAARVRLLRADAALDAIRRASEAGGAR